MEPTDLRGALQQAIRALFARNRSHFGAGGPEYYGVEVLNVSDDGSQFDLALTFKTGTRYCCMELGCHLPFALHGANKAKWIKRFRQLMTNRGYAELGPITINNVHVIVEEGAIVDIVPNQPKVNERRSVYDSGPFREIDLT